MIGMRSKYLMVCLFLAISVLVGRAEQFQKVSPDSAGFTIQPFTNSDSNAPATMDPSLRGPLLDPTVPVNGPGAPTVVPEPATIAMLFLGSGCAAAFTALRRRRRG